MATAVRSAIQHSRVALVPLADTLHDLGLTIIPTEKAERFKRRYRFKKMLFDAESILLGEVTVVMTGVTTFCVWAAFFATRKGFADTGIADRILDGLVALICVGIAIGIVAYLWREIPRTIRIIRTSEWHVARIYSILTPRLSYGMPKNVLADAMLVQSTLPEAELELETFKQDPFLWVRHDKERVCIAHWG